jgi:hypothetical protein
MHISCPRSPPTTSRRCATTSPTSPSRNRAICSCRVEQRLRKLPDEPLSSPHLTQLFGSPLQLAADLRTAAGHPERPVSPAVAEPSWVRQWLTTQAGRPRLATKGR